MVRLTKAAVIASISAIALNAAFFTTTTYAKPGSVELAIGGAVDGDSEDNTEVYLSTGVFGGSTVSTGNDDDESSEGEAVEGVVTIEDGINYVMANVSDCVNVREEPDEEASVAGKLYKNCTGKILEKGDGWTKIESGKLIGWVMNDYLLFDEEAEALMEEVGTLNAVSITDALRVRKEASEDSGVYKLLELNEKIEAVEELGDWVSVKVDDETVGYVAAEFVEVSFDADHGKTIAQLEAEEKEKQQAKLKKNRGAVATSGNDVTLLAALIQAEAGSQPYEGKVAVGAVVMNRVRSGGYPNSIQAVITQPGQFPPATNGTVSAILARGPSASCVQAAQAAVNGATTVGGALHFGSAASHSGIVIGGHAFY